ncbi:MAG: electron transfer flavoprotein subunit alpha/FixB family protein, partial [Eggerthellaceae bacterium]|nr:electron transfer flavoprotein subunit alpha/FixB family protein [Eggerthellaceae bacterium]
QSARELISAAQSQDADSIYVFVYDESAADSASKSGATKVVLLNLEEGALKEDAAPVVADEAKKDHSAVILLPNSRRMINVAGRIAAELGSAPIVDVREISDEGAKHMIYGGKVAITEKALGDYAVIVVQKSVFEPAAEDKAPCEITTMDVPATGKVKVIYRREKEEQAVDLSSAKTIVCIGRGVNSKEGFDLCESLTDALGGAMACTRPVTETENPLMPRNTYIGASGITVKPDLYFGVAVSGQTQHLMGMYESGTVVVVNKDKNVPFFKACDYGIVGDYEEVVPAIIKALEA